MVDLEPFARLKLCGLSLNCGRFGLRHCHPVGVFVVGRFKCAARFDKKRRPPKSGFVVTVVLNFIV